MSTENALLPSSPPDLWDALVELVWAFVGCRACIADRGRRTVELGEARIEGGGEAVIESMHVLTCSSISYITYILELDMPDRD